MNERIARKAVQQSENVFHRQAAFAPVHELNGAAGLQIDTRNQQVDLPCLPNGDFVFAKISLELAQAPEMRSAEK